MPAGSRLHGDTVLQGSRARIYQVILERPGVTFLELCAATSGHHGVTSHHLYILEKFHLVRSYKTGRCRRYYPAGGPAEETRRHAFLQQPYLRETLDSVTANPGATLTAIAATFPGVSRQAVAYRLSVLVSLGMVVACREGRRSRFHAYQTPDVPTLASRAAAASVGAI